MVENNGGLSGEKGLWGVWHMRGRLIGKARSRGPSPCPGRGLEEARASAGDGREKMQHPGSSGGSLYLTVAGGIWSPVSSSGLVDGPGTGCMFVQLGHQASHLHWCGDGWRLSVLLIWPLQLLIVLSDERVS